MSSRSDALTLIALSDLHLGCGAARGGDEPTESFLQEDALVGLLAGLTESAESTHLLLLGDSFELPGGVIDARRWRHCLEVRVEELQTRLHRIAAAHRPVFDALSKFSAAGGSIHVVPGNHDPALHIPEVFQNLRSLVVSETSGDFTLHAGAFRLDGVLHAEHGNRLHDINAHVVVDGPYSTGGNGIVRVEDPLGSALHRARLRGTSASSIVSSMVDLTRAALWGAWYRSARVSEVDPALEALAPSVAIGTMPALLRVARRSLNRKTMRRDNYMIEGAIRTHEALARRRLEAPLYLFGHSHRSTDERIGDGSIRYLNTGSWSTWGDHTGTGSLPFVVVQWGNGEPRAELCAWPESGRGDHQLRRIRSLA